MKNLISFALIATLLMSCTTEKNTVSGWNYHASEQGGFEVGDKVSDEYTLASSRMMIYNADMKVRVEDTDSANEAIASIAYQHGGHIMTLGRYRSVIKVRSENLSEAMQSIATLGKQMDSHVEGKDVTDEYMDLGIRLENAQKKRQNYLKLLEKAHNLDMALRLEKELERVNNEIDRMKGRIHQLEDRVAYSRISVNWHGKFKPGVFTYAGLGIYEAVKWLFVRG